MKKLYIHLGLPKSGTSAIEYFFYINNNLLSERCNIYYPILSNNHKHNMQELFNLHKNRDIWQNIKSYSDFLEDHDIFISSEIASWNFVENSHQNMCVVKEIFQDDYEIKFIIYVRPSDKFFKSWFTQHYDNLINNRIPWDSAKYTQNYADSINLWAATTDNNVFYPSKLIENIIDNVGYENSIFRIYDKKYLKNNDIIDDIFHIIGKEIPSEAIRGGDVNSSWPPEALPYLSYAVMPRFDAELRKEIADFVHTAFTTPTKINFDDIERSYYAEMEKIAEYIPEFKDELSNRKLDFSFPEVEVKNKELFLNIALTYTLLNKVNMLKNDIDNDIRNILENIQNRSLLKHETKKILKFILHRLPPAVKESLRRAWHRLRLKRICL
jgi:hypothetical protein